MKFWDFLAKGKIELAYGALWSYSPWGTSPLEKRSRDYRYYLKNEQTVEYEAKKRFMSEVVAQVIVKSKTTLPFMSLFQSNPVLVPVTRSSLLKPDSLWVGLKVATAMHKAGLGSAVAASLVRIRAVGTKASAEEHYDSQRVEQKLLTDPENIVLVDDFVTRGATMIASALRLWEAYPKANIAGFAPIRTVSNPSNFKRINDPVFNTITLYPSGKCHRDPD